MRLHMLMIYILIQKKKSLHIESVVEQFGYLIYEKGWPLTRNYVYSQCAVENELNVVRPLSCSDENKMNKKKTNKKNCKNASSNNVSNLTKKNECENL